MVFLLKSVPWDEPVKHSVLKKLDLAAREILRWKAVSTKAWKYDAAPPAATARLQKSLEYFGGLRK